MQDNITNYEEFEKNWNKEAFEWAEEQAKEEDFGPLVTPLKPLSIWRREFALNLFKNLDFKHFGGISLRALTLIDLEIEHVTSSKDKAEEIRQQMERGIEQLQQYIEKNGSHSLDDSPLEKIMLLDDDCMEHLYSLTTKLYNDKNYDNFKDLSFFLVMLNPYVASYQINCGIANQLNEELDEALFCYELATELNPNNPYAFLYAAECALKLNLEGKAHHFLERIQLIDSDEFQDDLKEIKNQALELMTHLKQK